MNLRRRIQRLRQRKANVRFRELVSLVEAAGWELRKVKGSHHYFVKKGRTIAIFNYSGALKPIYVDRALDELEREFEEEDERT